MRRKKDKKNIWIICGLILVLILGYGAYWGYGQMKKNQRQDEIEARLEVLRETAEKNPEDVLSMMKYAIALHDYANAERLEKSLEIFLQVMELDPDNPTAIGYYGSALTKKANYLESIPDKVETLQAGLDIMDKNITDHPNSFAARMVRAENNYYLPDMFGRIETSVKDFEYLLGMTKDGNYASMIPYLKYRLGQAYIKAERLDDGKKILMELIEEYPDNDNSKRAKKILDNLK